MANTAKGLTQVALESSAGVAVAAKRLLPATSKFNLRQKFDEPKEQRGSFDLYFNNMQLLTRWVEYEVKGLFYPETCNGLLYLALGNSPVIANTAAAAPNPAYNTYTFTPGDTLSTATFEEFDGTNSWNYPFAFAEKLTLETTAEKTLAYTLTGKAQDRLPMGSNPASGGTPNNAVTALAQPTDLPLNGTNATVFIDPLGGTIGTTSFADLISAKIEIDLKTKPIWTFSGPNGNIFTRLYRERRVVNVELELDFRSVAEYQYFASGSGQSGPAYRYVQINIGGGPLAGGATKNTSLTLNLPLRYLTWDADKTKENTTAKVKGVCYYDATLGYSHQVKTQIVSAGSSY